jgi:UDP:flavonoid glycosyltransferase YjiC (YdhE family)
MKQKGNGGSRVVVRTDASQRLGYGHLRRCATLGRKLSESGVAVHFILKAQDVDLSAELNGFVEASVLFDPELDGEADATRTVVTLEQIAPSSIIIKRMRRISLYS